MSETRSTGRDTVATTVRIMGADGTPGPVRALSPAAVLLAHQGGWDEALLIGGPIVVIIGLLMLAKRRVDATHDDHRTADN